MNTIDEILRHFLELASVGTVSRWEERIRIANIKSVTWDDSVADEAYELFEQLLRFVEGHSHSEAYEAPPEPADLQKMISRIQNLVTKTKARRSS